MQRKQSIWIDQIISPKKRTKEAAAIVLLSYVSELHSHNFVRDA